jgi:hypothetical protein
MSNTIDLKGENGENVLFSEDKSGVIAIVFGDNAGQSIDPSTLQTIELTLQNVADASIINGRDGDDIKDTAGGVLLPSGILELTLGPADNPIVGQHCSQSEQHQAQVDWTYFDLQGNPQSGGQEMIFGVNAALVPCDNQGWVG